MKTEILQKIESRNAETEKNINANINSIKQDVQANKEEIEKINERLDKLKNTEVKSEARPTYAEATAKHKFLAEARKIVGLMPINNDDIEKHIKDNDDVKDAIKATVDDFLKLELKMTKEEFKDLNIIDISGPKKEDTQRVYLHCMTEDGPQYVIRKNIQIKNDDVRIVPFVPPQVYRRFSELSRLTFIARKDDTNLKTQIRIGDSDLILLVRDKDEKEWTVTDINRFGELPPIDFYKSWPLRKMPPVTSPPKGRQRKEKNVHNISRSLEEEATTAKKKHKNKTLGGVSNL